MTEKHISLPKPFTGGDIAEWLQHFDICCEANAWDGDKKLKKLPTLLEGEALAIWLELGEDDKTAYTDVKEKLLKRMKPDAFTALDELHKRVMRPDEPLALYAHRLKWMVDQAGIEGSARDKMVLHQFLAGLPRNISRQLRAAGQTEDLQKMIERARLLIGIEKEPVASITEKDTTSSTDPVVTDLKEQVAALSKQVESLSSQQQGPQRQTRSFGRNTVRCYRCGGFGHMSYQCRARSPYCFNCGRSGHFTRDCRQRKQGNGQGVAGWGSSRTGQ